MEVGCIVSNVELVADLAPADDIVVELFALGALIVIDGVREAAVDGAQTNANVVARLCNLGSLLRVLISQRVNGKVGVIYLQIFRHFVDEAKERARGGAILLLNF
jgi:hypothetical protein